MTQASPAARPQGGFGASFAALVAGALAMGISPIFVRLADVGPFASAFWRVALALPLLWAWLRIAEAGAPSDRRIGRADVFAGLAFAGDLFFWHLSIVTTSVANATFFATCAPIWVVAFGWLLFGERAAFNTLAGVVLCVAGGAALLAQSFHLRPAGAIGDLYGVATGVFFGLYFLAVKAARRTHSAARVTFVATVVSAALLLIVALALDHVILPHTLRGIGALVGMAWISHAGGQGLLSIALGRLPAAFSSLVIFLEAIAAAGFAFLLLGEPVSLVQGLGGLLILAGIYVARPTGAKAGGGAAGRG